MSLEKRSAPLQTTLWVKRGMLIGSPDKFRYPRVGVSGVLPSSRWPYESDEMLWVAETIKKLSGRNPINCTQLALSPVFSLFLKTVHCGFVINGLELFIKNINESVKYSLSVISDHLQKFLRKL